MIDFSLAFENDIFSTGETLNRVSVDEDYVLQPGETIEMWFRTYSDWVWLEAAEVTAIHWRLANKFPDLEIVNESSSSDSGFYIIRLKLSRYAQAPDVQQASVLTAAIIAAAIIGGGLLFWLSLDKVYKITASPAGQIALVGVGTSGIALLVIATIALFTMLVKK